MSDQPRAPDRILVVEDQTIVAADISQCLTRLGYEVVGAAKNSRDCLAKCRRLLPDLVLMDITLQGDVDGIATASAVRAELDIPVVFLTAHADGPTFEKAKTSEPFGYVLKPFQERELQITIELALCRHRLGKQLEDVNRWLAAVLSSIADGVIATRADGCIAFANPAAEMLTGRDRAQLEGQRLNLVFADRAPADGRDGDRFWSSVLQADSALGPVELAGADRPGRAPPRTIEVSAGPIHDGRRQLAGRLVVLHDVTDRRQAEKEREQLIRELRSALGQVKTLSGLLPICAWCRKVRDDDGYWQQLEDFLRQNSGLEPTPGICPDCATRVGMGA